jgi:hypothetical protein
MTVTADFSHRRFFKNISNTLLVGNNLPNVQVMEHGVAKPLYSYIRQYMILTFISTSCKSCIDALNAMETIVSEKPGINIVVLIDGDEQTIATLDELFYHKVVFLPYARKEMGNTIGVKMYPWSYGINAKGQVVTSYNCESVETFHSALRPFLSLIDGHERND